MPTSLRRLRNLPVKEEPSVIATFINRELIPYLNELAGALAETGADGSSSDSGGESFVMGPPGTPGATGSVGLQGSPGSDGERGDTGDMGPPGTQGPVGNTGPQGPRGEDGQDGPPGDMGPPGDSSNPLRPIPDQRALGNDSGGIAYPYPVTIHQELDWVGGNSTWLFDGVDDRVNFGNNNNIDRLTAATLVGTFRTSTGDNDTLFAKQNAGSPFTGYFIEVETGFIRFFLRGTSIGNEISVRTNSASFADGNEHHFQVVYTGSGNATGVSIHVDGVTQAVTIETNALSTSSISTGNLYIGFPSAGSFDGSLRHMAIFNVALNSTQRAEVYNGGAPPDLNALATTPGPIFWVKMDESDSAAVNGVIDYGTGAHNGTAEGGLAPIGAVGSMLVRGTSVWQLVPPGNRALQYLRRNKANTALEWGALTSDVLSGLIPPGPDGQEGPAGDIGPPGTTGARGAPGLDGRPGTDGEQGIEGEPGIPGATGVTGATGLQGSPGIDGDQGPEGEMGPFGGVLSDGVRGDLTITSGGTTYTVNNATITPAKMADAPALSVLNRFANSAGVPAWNAVGAGSSAVFRESASTLGFGVIVGAGMANAIVTPDKVALVASSLAVMIVLGPFSLPSGGVAATPDDVTLYSANLPFGIRILDVLVLVTAAVAASTVQLRTASGGGGSALSSAIGTALTGTNRNNDTATRTVGIGGSIFARRSDSTVQGTVLIFAYRI